MEILLFFLVLYTIIWVGSAVGITLRMFVDKMDGQLNLPTILKIFALLGPIGWFTGAIMFIFDLPNKEAWD